MAAIGVTGQMGTGKTYLIDALAACMEQRHMPVRIISIDNIRRYLMTLSPNHWELRKSVAERFGLMQGETGFDLQALAAAVFGAANGPEDFWHIVGPEIVEAVRLEIRRPGDSLLEWARLAEDGFLPLVDHVIVTRCTASVQRQRLEGGDLPPEQVQKRLSLQLSAEEIAARLEKSGKPYCLFDTSMSPPPAAYQRLCDEVFHEAA
jgi:dephospho-CoA kinase